MKKSTLFLLFSILTMCMTGLLPGQTADFSGTWVGSTVVPDNPEKDQVTLTLKKDGDSYAGTITDSLGLVNQAALKGMKFDKDTFSFYFMASTGEQDLRVDTILKVSGGKLVGTWTSEAGDSGSFELEHKKQY